MTHVKRVEPHQRHPMGNQLFLLCVRHRICMPRNWFIRWNHRVAVTGWEARSTPAPSPGALSS